MAEETEFENGRIQHPVTLTLDRATIATWHTINLYLDTKLICWFESEKPFVDGPIDVVALITGQMSPNQ